MRKILISNIGNRNIAYKGEQYDRKKQQQDFRSWTLSLRENLDEERAHIELRIINDLLSEIAPELDQVILYGSNQIGEAKQDQDTLHEAFIMKQLIEVQYSLPVSVDQEVNCKVTDNDALLRFYRKELSYLKRKFPEHRIVICDAGGTAQQKSALKIMAEFLLDKDTFEVWYVNPDGTLELVPRVEYRNVIVAEQIKQLIDLGEYTSAYRLKGYDSALACASSDNISNKLLGLGALLTSRYWEDLSAFVGNCNSKQVKNSPLLRRIKQRKSQIGNEHLAEIFTAEDFFSLGEMLSSIQFYHSAGLHTQAVMNFALFYEFYLSAAITYNLGYDLLDNFDEEKDRLIDECRSRFPNVARSYPYDKIFDSIPFRIRVAENISNPANLKFVILLRPYISTGKFFKVSNQSGAALGINTVRNHIAHRGKAIDEVYMQSHLPYFAELLHDILELFLMPENNSFLKMNAYIKQNL